MSTLIKICGITSVEDAIASIEAGADYLGLIFVASSPRTISLAAAREITREIRGRAMIVGVFQNAPSTLIHKHTENLELDLIQLHGNESPEVCSQMPRPVIKAITTQGFPNMESISKYLPDTKHNIHSLLLDFPKTSVHENWTNYPHSAASELKHSRHFIAGRITPETVAEIVTRFQPDGIDVASGVESQPGIKDQKKMLAFCQAVRDVNSNLLTPQFTSASPTHNEPSICAL